MESQFLTMMSLFPYCTQVVHGTITPASPQPGAPTIPSFQADAPSESDPPKVLAIGPDRAGNLLEVIMLDLAGDGLLAIHAMPLRPAFHDLLPQGGDDDG